MKQLLRISVICLIVVVACLSVVSRDILAQATTSSSSGSRPEGRAGSWEFILPLIYADSATIDGQGGSSVDINPDWGFGFGFGYNFSDNFQLNSQFTWNSRSYDATIVQDDGTRRQYNNWMDTSTLSLNGIFYFLKGKFSPFVSGGVGITSVDTNIQNGVASTPCWYDPWWGYVCGGYVPTKTENDVSYNAGVGVRLDIRPGFSLQAGYNKTWIDFGKSSSTPDFDIWKLDLVFPMP